MFSWGTKLSFPETTPNEILHELLLSKQEIIAIYGRVEILMRADVLAEVTPEYASLKWEIGHGGNAIVRKKLKTLF